MAAGTERALVADRSRASGTVRKAGLLCILGGAGWVVIGMLSSVLGQTDGATFVFVELVWLVIQALLLIGVVGLALSGAAPGWLGVVGIGIALLGRADFVLAEIHSLIIGEESVLLPIGALVTAVGMTLVGVAVLRAKRWESWRRFTPLLAGAYPFVAMFPFIAISNEPNMLAIAVWGLPWLLLGYAMYSNTGER